MSNVISINMHPKKTGVQAAEQNPLEEKMIKQGEISKDDRKILASNLGKMILNKANEDGRNFKSVTKEIFNNAPWQDAYNQAERKKKAGPSRPDDEVIEAETFLLKRYNYITVPNQPHKKTLVASEWPYRALIESLADYTGKRAWAYRRALKGTSFITNQDIPKITDKVWGPVSSVVKKASLEILSRTDINESCQLYRLNSEALTQRPDSDYEEAYEVLRGKLAKAHDGRLAPQRGGSLPDHMPAIRVGALVRQVSKSVFIVPPAIQEAFACLFQQSETVTQEADESRQVIIDWILSIGGYTDNGSLVLPNIPYNPDKGFGWVGRIFNIRRDIWVQYKTASEGVFSLFVQPQIQDRYSAEQLIPAWDEGSWSAENGLKTVVSEEDGYASNWSWYDPSFSFHCHNLFDTEDPIYFEDYGPLFWPSALGRPPSQSLIGLVDANTEEWLDYWPDCDLRDIPDDDQMEILHDTSARFLMLAGVEGTAPDPLFKDGTAIAAISRSLKSGSATSITASLFNQAKIIGEATVEYLDELTRLDVNKVTQLFKDDSHG